MYAQLAQRPIFVPAIGAFRQGILVTVPLELRLLAPDVNGTTLHACLARHYAEASHVRVLPHKEPSILTYLDPQVLNGTNDMHLNVFHNEESGQVLLSAVFDNLGKGASGAAIQNLDLMLTRQ